MAWQCCCYCPPLVDRTLVIVKPDGVERGLIGEIIGRLERKNLRLVAAELRTVTTELAQAHYAEHADRPFFPDLVEFFTRSPVLLMVIEGPKDTYAVVRTMMGVTNPAEAAPERSGATLASRRPRIWCTAPTPRVGRTGNRPFLPGTRLFVTPVRRGPATPTDGPSHSCLVVDQPSPNLVPHLQVPDSLRYSSRIHREKVLHGRQSPFPPWS